MSKFSDMPYDELMAELAELLSAARNASVSLRSVQQLGVLPAIERLKELTNSSGQRDPERGYQDSLRLLGLNPGTVRRWQWEGRASNQEIRRKIGELPKKSPRERQYDKAAAAMHDLAQLVEVVISGDERRAEDLAWRINDAYAGFPLR
jgi:hypothetical protein